MSHATMLEMWMDLRQAQAGQDITPSHNASIHGKRGSTFELNAACSASHGIDHITEQLRALVKTLNMARSQKTQKRVVLNEKNRAQIQRQVMQEHQGCTPTACTILASDGRAVAVESEPRPGRASKGHFHSIKDWQNHWELNSPPNRAIGAEGGVVDGHEGQRTTMSTEGLRVHTWRREVNPPETEDSGNRADSRERQLKREGRHEFRPEIKVEALKSLPKPK
eukprot:Gb_00447 [translate_table: standard]